MQPEQVTGDNRKSGNQAPTPNADAPADTSGWQYSQEASAAQTPSPTPPQPVSWTASEYVARHKNAGWFLAATLVIVVLSAGIFVITRDILSTVVMAIVGLAFATFAGRPPRVLEYSVDNQGIHVAQKSYLYNQFRSFSLFEEGAVRSILLMPARRLGLPLTIHYDPGDEERITTVLGGHLPFEEREVPAVDRLMTKIHF